MKYKILLCIAPEIVHRGPKPVDSRLHVLGYNMNVILRILTQRTTTSVVRVTLEFGFGLQRFFLVLFD